MKKVMYTIYLLLLSGCISSDYERLIVEARPMPEIVVAEPDSEVVTVEAVPEIPISRWQKTTEAQKEQWHQEAIDREEKIVKEQKVARKEQTNSIAPINLTELQRLHQWVQDGLTSGAVHSVNVEYNEVRMDPGPWSFLPVEQKKIILTCFSRYFDLKGSTGRVTILSKYSDKKLATYGSWGGMRILE